MSAPTRIRESNDLVVSIKRVVFAILRGVLSVYSVIACFVGLCMVPMLALVMTLHGAWLNQNASAYACIALALAVFEGAATWQQSAGESLRVARTAAAVVVRFAVYVGTVVLLSYEATFLAFVVGFVLQANDLYNARERQSVVTAAEKGGEL